jgi:hypothetical protein
MYELGLTEATLLSPEPPCKVCDISQGWDPESGGWTAAAAKKPGVAAINTVLPPGARLTIVDPEATGIYTSYRLGPPAGPAAPPHPAAPPKTAAAAHPAAPPQAEAAPPSVRPAAGGGTLEPGPASTPARPRLGSRVVSSTAVAALQLGALVLLGEAAERRGQRRFEEALADATPWIEEQVRIQSQSPTAQALRARSPQHKLYARLHVWQEEQFTYQTGPGIGEGWWAPSGFTYSFSPIVTLVDSLPAESPSVPYIDPGFGSYMNVTEFNLWFEINSSR